MDQWRNWASIERMAQVANFALDYMADNYEGGELYDILRYDFKMENEEIRRAGFSSLEKQIECDEKS